MGKIKTNIKFLYKFINHHISAKKKKLYLGVLLIFLNSLISYFFPFISIYIIDKIIPDQDFHALIQIFLLAAVLQIINQLASYNHQKIFINIKEHLRKTLQHSVFCNYRDLKLFEFEKILENDRYAYLTSDIINIKTMFDQTIISLVKNIFLSLIGILLMFSILPVFSLIIILICLSLFYVVKRTNKILYKYSNKLSEYIGKVMKSAFDPIQDFFTVKSLNIFNLYEKQFVNNQNNYNKIQIANSQLRAKLSSFESLIKNIFIIITFTYGGIKIINNDLTLGQLVGYNFYITLVFGSISSILNFNFDFQSVLSSIDRLNSFFSQKKEKNSGIPIFNKNCKMQMKFEGVSFQYPNSTSCFKLNNINLKLSDNEITALIGRNGTGKSTILKLMLGLYTDYKGVITINGINITESNLTELRNIIGFVPQRTTFIDGSIVENIILNNELDEKKLWEVIRICDLEKLILELDKKLLTPIQNSQIFLSGGYQQRVSFARALYKNPKMLILDEVSSNQDSYFKEELGKILIKIKHLGLPVLIITHELPLLKYVDKIYEINDGHIFVKTVKEKT